MALRAFEPRAVEYQGTWKSDDDCEILEMSQIPLAKCFKPDDGILVLGDSRGRQLARAMLAVMNDSVYAWV